MKVAEDSARGGFFLISGTALATVVMAIASILIANFLGPELYGQYALASVIPQLLYLFTDLGINQGVTKFTALFNSKGETGRVVRIIRSAMLLKASTGIVLFIVNYAFAESFATVFLNRPDLTFYLRIMSFTILFQVIFTTATSAFVGLDKTQYAAATTNIQALAKTILEITLVLIGLGIAGALTGYVISYVVAAVASMLFLFLIVRQKSGTKDDSDSSNELRRLMRYGAPLYVSVLLTGFIPLFQNLVLANFTTDADIGNYKAASNFATLMTVLSVPITTALLPAFSKIDSLATKKIRLFFRLANKYTTMIVVPVAVLIIIYSVQIVQIIYGSAYETAPLFLAIYCLLYLLVGFGYLTLTSFYNGLGETRITSVISLITFLTLAILSPILAKIYGVEGAIAAFLAASSAGTAYALITAKRKFQVELDTRSSLKIYSVSLVSGIPSLMMIRFLSLPKVVNLLAGGILYLVIYITLTAFTGIITSIELQTAMQITRRIRLLKFISTPILKYQQKIIEKRLPK